MSKRRQFSTGETMERAANNKARAIFADIRSRGFENAVPLHTRKDDVVEANPTIDQLADLYGTIAKTFEVPPSDTSIRVYTNNLKLIAGYRCYHGFLCSLSAGTAGFPSPASIIRV